MGVAIPSTISVDGVIIGDIHHKKYIRQVVSSGPHQLGVHIQGTNHMSVKLESNKVYFMEQTILSGFLSVQGKLTEVSGTKGRKRVRKYKLIASETSKKIFEYDVKLLCRNKMLGRKGSSI